MVLLGKVWFRAVGYKESYTSRSPSLADKALIQAFLARMEGIIPEPAFIEIFRDENNISKIMAKFPENGGAYASREHMIAKRQAITGQIVDRLNIDPQLLLREEDEECPRLILDPQINENGEFASLTLMDGLHGENLAKYFPIKSGDIKAARTLEVRMPFAYD